MKKLYLIVQITLCICIFIPTAVKSQGCSLLHATCDTYESRCAATGSIMVTATGGSGSYKYKVTGPVNTNFTSLDSITGLSAGSYTVIVNDITTNCEISVLNVVVGGNYQDPRFSLSKIDVSCDNGNNGSINATGLQYGLSPFVFRIMPPSPMAVGVSNSTGVFTGLVAGNYTIRLTDSCGGIQTRIVTINNYTWSITAYPFTKTSCDEASGFIKVTDSRGNISTVTGIPGFMYGVVRAPGDTIWQTDPNFTFQLLGHNNFQVVAKDACGTIKHGSTSVSLMPSVGAGVNTYGFHCSNFSASLFNITNFFNGEYCLYDSHDALIECNTTGVFVNIAYGSYCIKAHDACTDTTIQRCFSATQPTLTAASDVLISNKLCRDFTASITGQVGLTNPSYCLYDSLDVQVSCNSTGVFDNLPYAPYCIKINDGCVDTTFTRCFFPTRPTPILFPLIPAYITCTNFGIVVNGDSLTTPLYCLYDSSGVQLMCNNTGVFDSIPLGTYCVTVHDDCIDTTMIECITVDGPVVHNDLEVHISNEQCHTFTATASSSTLNIVAYCLYTSADVLVSCNATGEFDNVIYGDYCIKAQLACPDTLVSYCFSTHGAIPSVGATVSISNKTCTTFTATVTHLDNLNNAQFCIYDHHNVQVACNSTGEFDNLVYGSYCIRVTDGCYDTTIERCFTQSPSPVDLSITANKSCSYGLAQMNISLGGAVMPVNIKIYNPDGSLYLNQNYNTNNINIDNMPGTSGGAYYRIFATDNCGNKDSAHVGATASYVDHTPSINPKCPGGLWPNGAGDIIISARTNLGNITVRVTKKNGVSYSTPLSPDVVSGANYKFIDLGPGTYIVRTTESNCHKYVYDTVVIGNYQFPNLDRSTGYQCDVNGFSVSAVASSGVAPYMYEIIGSVPATPNINAGSQSSSIFNINNGASYSLIRLRAVDACGNATLGDASILPLANTGIIVTDNCFLSPTTLSVDSIYNATYEWYKKDSLTSTDSVYMGNSSSVYIPMLTLSDTGIYTCYLVVNAGCINRTYHFNLDGSCYPILPTTDEAELKGRVNGNKHLLFWNTEREEGFTNFVIERKSTSGQFTEIGTVRAAGNSTVMRQYNFTDMEPFNGDNYYRLRIIKANGNFAYTNTIVLGKDNGSGISIYPNPVKDRYMINFKTTGSHRYKILLLSNTNQLLNQSTFTSYESGRLEMQRPPELMRGVYLLRIIDLDTNVQEVQKIVFL